MKQRSQVLASLVTIANEDDKREVIKYVGFSW